MASSVSHASCHEESSAGPPASVLAGFIGLKVVRASRDRGGFRGFRRLGRRVSRTSCRSGRRWLPRRLRGRGRAFDPRRLVRPDRPAMRACRVGLRPWRRCVGRVLLWRLRHALSATAHITPRHRLSGIGGLPRHDIAVWRHRHILIATRGHRRHLNARNFGRACLRQHIDDFAICGDRVVGRSRCWCHRDIRHPLAVLFLLPPFAFGLHRRRPL